MKTNTSAVIETPAGVNTAISRSADSSDYSQAQAANTADNSPTPDSQLLMELFNSKNVRNGILMAEILGKPKCRRTGR